MTFAHVINYTLVGTYLKKNATLCVRFPLHDMQWVILGRIKRHEMEGKFLITYTARILVKFYRRNIANQEVEEMSIDKIYTKGFCKL